MAYIIVEISEGSGLIPLFSIYSISCNLFVFVSPISRGFYPRLDTTDKFNKFFDLQMVFTYVTRRPCQFTKQYKMFVQNLRTMEISSQRRGNLLFLYTNMAAITSLENDLLIELQFDAYIKLLLNNYELKQKKYLL